MADYKSMRAACAEARGGRIAARAGVKAGAAMSPARPGPGPAKPRAYADGGAVEGGRAKSRGHGKGHGKVAVNVIVAPQGGQPQARPVPVPVPMPAGGAGRPPMAGGPPPMPGAGLGAGPPGGPPPMGMRPPGMNKGGAITAGAGGGEGRLQKAKLMKHRDGAEDRDIGAAVA